MYKSSAFSLMIVSLLLTAAACSNDTVREDTTASKNVKPFLALDVNNDGGIDQQEAQKEPALREDFAEISVDGKVTERAYIAWSKSSRSENQL